MMLLCGWRKRRNNKSSPSSKRTQATNSSSSDEHDTNDNAPPIATTTVSTTTTTATISDANTTVKSTDDNSTENLNKSMFLLLLLLDWLLFSFLTFYLFYLVNSFISIDERIKLPKKEMRKKTTTIKKRKKTKKSDIQLLSSLNRCQSHFNLIWVFCLRPPKKKRNRLWRFNIMGSPYKLIKYKLRRFVSTFPLTFFVFFNCLLHPKLVMFSHRFRSLRKKKSFFSVSSFRLDYFVFNIYE